MEAAVRRRMGPPILIHPEQCTGCLICELRCSLRFVKAFNSSRSAIQVRRLVGGDHEFAVAFTDLCDNCGICARFCPYEALEWTKTGA
ncbi:MAG: 4Fe-4S binding protein [Candidatus Methylomirabilia bacterium]